MSDEPRLSDKCRQEMKELIRLLDAKIATLDHQPGYIIDLKDPIAKKYRHWAGNVSRSDFIGLRHRNPAWYTPDPWEMCLTEAEYMITKYHKYPRKEGGAQYYYVMRGNGTGKEAVIYTGLPLTYQVLRGYLEDHCRY